MRVFTAILISVCVVMFLLFWLLLANRPPILGDPNAWTEAYFAHARVPMFTGFLTAGSFLLTLQTGILQRLKDAYDEKEYRQRFEILKARNPEVKYYGSLRRLSVALSTNVILALSTAVAQMTIGFIQRPWSTALCIALGATTMGLIVYLTVQMFLAHRQWFEKIESEQAKSRDSFPPV